MEPLRTTVDEDYGDEADAEPETHEPEAEDPTPLAIVVRPGKERDTSQPKSGPPSLDEWQDFIGRIVIRSAANAYVNLMLRDMEDDLTDRERKSIELTKEDLDDISGPLASAANKSKFARKHGRKILSISDSYEAVVALVIWMRRVRRIARKHNKSQEKARTVVQGQVIGDNANGYSGPDDEQGQYAGGFQVFNPGTG